MEETPPEQPPAPPADEPEEEQPAAALPVKAAEMVVEEAVEAEDPAKAPGQLARAADADLSYFEAAAADEAGREATEEKPPEKKAKAETTTEEEALVEGAKDEAKAAKPSEAVGAVLEVGEGAKEERDVGEGEALAALPSALRPPDVASAQPLEEVAEEQAAEAAATAPLALLGPMALTADSILYSTSKEMSTIIQNFGKTKEDIVELCSSGSLGAYADIWAEHQGKQNSSWVPSLSASAAVRATPHSEDHLQEDGDPASAHPRVLLSSKVVFPTNLQLDSKKQTRFASPPVTRRPRLASHVSLLTPPLPCLIAHASLLRSSDGKYGSQHEVLDSTLVAYPFEDKQPSVVYVEMGQTDESKQRVRRDLSPGPNPHPHPHSLSHPILGAIRVLLDGGLLRAPPVTGGVPERDGADGCGRFRG
jgi:hypothetical protein